MTNTDFTFWPDAQCDEFERRGHWQPFTLGQCLRQWAQARGEAVALVEQDTRLSYAQLDRQADHLAWGFARQGIQKGDRVLLQLPNGIAFVTTLFGLLRLGALPILAMPAQRQSDIGALCDLAEPVAYICKERFMGFDYAALAREVAAERPCIKHVILDSDEAAGPTLTNIAHSGSQWAGQPPTLPEPHHRDPALLLLSGGTTGTPKLIPRTHADYAYNARASAALCGLDEHSVYLAALPVAHNFPLACPGVLGTLASGGTAVLAHTPGPDECFALIEREGVTLTSLVPPLVQVWLEAREWDDADLGSLKYLQVGGARCESLLASKVTPGLGCGLQQVFGMAEGLLCYTRLDDPLEQVLHSQGRPLCADDEVRLVNEDGLDVAPGETGELLTRGPYTLRGYYRAQAQNARSFTPDGYYRSGDLARWTADGNLVVEGRIKEQVNRAGEKIATEEVEQALCFHPSIVSAALVGLPDERLGERSCAFLITDGQQPDLAQVRAFLMARGLAGFKCPDQIEFVHHWPLTPIGKVDKRRLARSLEQRPVETRAPLDTFIEQSLPLTASPMELASELLRRHLQDDATLYEREGVWHVALGRKASLQASGNSVSLHHGEQHLILHADDPCQMIAQALGTLSLQGWRAYGAARFEMASVIHGVDNPASQETLLELVVPQREVRFCANQALVRALDPQTLAALCEEVAALDRQLSVPGNLASLTGRALLVPAIESHGAAHYQTQVARAVGEIHAGRYDKVILSRKVPVPGEVDLLASYRLGRSQNTPARSFVLSRDTLQIVGFSPETVVEVSATGQVSTQPLAGTRAMGETLEQTLELRRDLLRDVKEIAEHAVSVKLAVEELQAICEADSVQVCEFMTVSERGPVQHLASRVKGQLRASTNAWHAFAALFPAVTASGIPKQPAIEAIQRLEDQPRGPYSGSVMMVDCDGSLDAALVLRSLFRQGDQTWLQAGAGIVAPSTPARELQETIEKFASISRCLVAVEAPADAPARSARTLASAPQ